MSCIFLYILMPSNIFILGMFPIESEEGKNLSNIEDDYSWWCWWERLAGREQKINPVHYLQPTSYPVTSQSHLWEKISLIFQQTILGRHWVRPGNSSQTNKKHPPAPHQQSQHRPRTWKYECKHSSPPPPTPPVFALPRAEGGNILDRIISRGLLTTVEDLLRHV